MFGRGEELLVILLLVLVLFGGQKIPQLLKGLGEGMKEFKNATKDEDPAKPVAAAPPAPAAPPSVTPSTTENHS